MKTRDKILIAALNLFNKDGIDSVTVRLLAQESGISHGNLQYHFPNMDNVITELYNQLAAGFDELLETTREGVGEPVNTFRESITSSFNLIYKYRFIFLHFVEIGRRIPAVRAHYQQNLKSREPQFLGLFQLLQESGLMQKNIPPAILRLFVHQVFIVTDFWLSSNEISLRLQGKRALKYYTDMFWAMFYPWLTARGRKEFITDDLLAIQPGT